MVQITGTFRFIDQFGLLNFIHRFPCGEIRKLANHYHESRNYSLKIIFLSYKMQKNPRCTNDEIYKHAKSQCEMLCILGYTKLTNMWI
jgi:hypothetical protein